MNPPTTQLCGDTYIEVVQHAKVCCRVLFSSGNCFSRYSAIWQTPEVLYGEAKKAVNNWKQSLNHTCDHKWFCLKALLKAFHEDSVDLHVGSHFLGIN